MYIKFYILTKKTKASVTSKQKHSAGPNHCSTIEIPSPELQKQYEAHTHTAVERWASLLKLIQFGNVLCHILAFQL